MRVRGFRPPLVANALVVFMLASGFCAAARAEGPVTNEPDPDRGKALAERLCTNCHLVSDTQSNAVADVPTFKEIADRPDQTAAAIMGRIAVPKHPMPVIPITKRELEDVSAYIMSLRSR